jgi:hypothetical protein
VRAAIELAVLYTWRVTFILGWQDADGAYICADSAVTHDGPVSGSTSSFGEAQQLDRVAVEERAVKLLELPRGVLVGLCGDANAALDFVRAVGKKLHHTDTPLVTSLREVGTVADLRDRFSLLFGHRVDGRPTLTAFHSADRSIEDLVGDRCATFGSMPPDKKDLAAQLIGVVRKFNLRPEARLACTLVALQSLGITEYLPQHGVGGAFFGARVTADGVVWQPDLCYLTYPPGMFAGAPLVTANDTRTEIPSTSAAQMVRVLVREGAGILLSSLGKPRGRVLIPPTSGRSQAEWEAVVLNAVPPPFHLLVQGAHFGLLSTRYTKAVYIYNPALRTDRALSITQGDKAFIGAVPRLVETLELPAPVGRFDLTVITEDEDGTNGGTRGIELS